MDELEQIQQQIAELKKKAEEIAYDRKQAVIDDIKAKIKAYAITAKELGYADKGAAKTSTVAVKYRSGDQTWTGRGKQPKWVVQHLANGGRIEDLLVS